MKPTFARTLQHSGFALLMVMFTLVAMTLVMGSVMFWLSTNVKQTGLNNSFTTSNAAAEGVTEMAFAEMDRDFLLSSLGPASSYIRLLPIMTNWPIQFVFSDTNGTAGQISVSIGTQSGGLQPLGGQFADLEGYAQTVTVTATATPVGQLYNQPATVQQQFTFATVPAFQFAIFYNINLEIDPGATMPITGAVFSNGGIWSGTANVTYHSSVEAAGQVNTSGTDPWLPSKTDNGTPAANFLLAHQPVSSVDPLEIPIGASGTNNNNETNVIAIIELPPATVAAPQGVAYASSNQVYTFNEATLIVSNWSSGIFSNNPSGNNFSVYMQDPGLVSFTAPASGHFSQLTNDFYIVTNAITIGTNTTVYTNVTIVTNNLFVLPGFTTNTIPSTINPWSPAHNVGVTWTYNTTNHYGVKYAGWSWLTNAAMYDYREGKAVQAVQIVVSNLCRWVTNSSVTGGSNWNYALAYDRGKGIDSIYVYNSVPLTSSQLPAVRMTGGIRLPNSTNVINGTNCVTSGLTVVTPQPLYVWGDYNLQTNGDNASGKLGTNNMAHTYPAAFMADAITILSDNWTDSYTNGTTLSTRSPANTAVNAACLEGIVQSSTNYPSGVSGYSGGVENFLRLLENWGGILTYNGSIMVMFPSQYATNWWITTGTYYNAPTRVWSFDSNFTNQNLLPPLTPKFTTVIRSNWYSF